MLCNDSTEQWEPIKGFERIYEVSNFGRVRVVSGYITRIINYQFKRFKSKGKILTPSLNAYGYYSLQLGNEYGERKTFLVHRLVAMAFHEKPHSKERLQVNHKDGNKTNNHADNLEWCTAMQNVHHALNMGLVPCKYPLSAEQIASVNIISRATA